MPLQRSTAPATQAPAERSQTRKYVLVIIIEVLTVAGLYWLGRSFS